MSFVNLAKYSAYPVYNLSEHLLAQNTLENTMSTEDDNVQIYGRYCIRKEIGKLLRYSSRRVILLKLTNIPSAIGRLVIQRHHYVVAVRQTERGPVRRTTVRDSLKNSITYFRN